MFHHPSSSIGGIGDSNVQSISRPRSILSHQNENAKTPAKSSLGRGTSSSSSRRAFGDISNNTTKTPSNNNNAHGKDHVNAVKPKSSNAFTPGSSKKPFQSRIPKSTTTVGSSNKQQPLKQRSSHNPLSKRTHPWSAHTNKTKSITRPSSSSARSRIASPAPSTYRQVDFVLPASTRPVQQAEPDEPEVAAVVEAKPATPQTKKLEPVDDVELPAGRLWVEQLEHDDPLGENDDWSTSSMGETLDRRTMWDDWRDSMMRQWEQEKIQRELADEQEMQAQLDKVLRDEGQGEWCVAALSGQDVAHWMHCMHIFSISSSCSSVYSTLWYY